MPSERRRSSILVRASIQIARNDSRRHSSRGGLVAYGGFLGGYIGSWLYLQRHNLRLMPWADVAVPSLASGLLITRIGCYLFGCDFGKRLPDGAPGFLKKLGTFPKWTEGTLDGGLGSPAYAKHFEAFKGTPLGAQIEHANASLFSDATRDTASLGSSSARRI